VLAMQSTAAATAEASFWTTLSSTSVAVAGITAWKLLYYVFVALGICFYVYIIVNLILRRIPLQEKPGEQEEIKPSAYRNCPYCGVLIRSDAAGCDYCGIAFGEEPVYRCVRCKKIYPEKHDRCPACGAPVWQLDGIPMREKPKVKEEPAPVRGLPLPKVSVILGTTALYAVVIIAVSFFSTVYQLGTEDVRTLHERKPDYPGMRQLEQLAKETPPPVQGVPQEVGRTQKAAVNKGAVQQPPTRDRASQLLAELQASQFAQEPRIRAAIVELGDAAMPALQNALSSKESRMRQFAIPLLSGLHATQAVPALIQNVSHPDAAVRMSAIEALAKLGKTPAITALIKILGDSDVGVRRSAARALGELRAREAIPGLMMALNDSDSKVSELAWHSLQKISNQDLPQDNAVWITWWTIHQTQVDLSPRQRIATLRDKLQDSDPWVRAFAAEQLGHYKDPSTVSGLAALLSDDAPQVRRYAQRAMAEVTGVDFGTNDSQWVAWGIFCQGQQAQADMVLQRVQAVQREQDQRDVIASTVRLGELAIPALSSLVMKGNKSERFNAAVALSQIHRPAAIEPLQAALDDERELLRKTIIENLATFEDPAVKPLLLRALKDASPAVQERAATLLGKLHDYSAVPALLDRLQNTQVPVEERRVAARMLGNLADPSSAPALLQVLGKEPLLRSDIALALGNMRIREAVPELMRIVQSASEEKDYPLMAKTISALGMIGDASSLSLVMEALDTPNSEVHTAAIGAAGAIGGPGVATVLVKELNGIWWETAARTLGSIGSDKGIKPHARI
jgi:HEAT repeat protein/RNA polymerase subunit RPABC4/transcription elongation factor Spt4